MPRHILWRRLDCPGLERLVVDDGTTPITARGLVLSLDGGGMELEHCWTLERDWRTRVVNVVRRAGDGERRLVLERQAGGWRADGAARPDLEGCAEADLSATPFCNTLAIRTLGHAPGDALTIDVAYIDAASLEVVRSRQRYERLSARRVRYTDLGVARGFTAEIEIDDHALVTTYAGLFELVEGT